MDFELRDIRWAVTAAQHRSLRQAAEALNVRQSTLSRRLKDLEFRFGADLFERTNGGTKPTIAGKEFLETARRLIEEADAALTRLKARCRGESGLLTLGLYAALSTGNLRATLSEYRRRFPDVDIHTADGPRSRLFCDLSGKTIDIAIVTTHGSCWDDRMLPLWSERIIVALPDQHRLAARSTLKWGELANERLLLPLRDPGPELAQLARTKLCSVGDIPFLHQDVSLDRLLSLVGAGFGPTLILEGATGAHYDGVVFREVHGDDGPTRLNFVACWQEANSNPTLGSFLDVLRERYPDLSPARSPPDGFALGPSPGLGRR